MTHNPEQCTERVERTGARALRYLSRSPFTGD
jgi:hypothetical protein